MIVSATNFICLFPSIERSRHRVDDFAIVRARDVAKKCGSAPFALSLGYNRAVELPRQAAELNRQLPVSHSFGSLISPLLDKRAFFGKCTTRPDFVDPLDESIHRERYLYIKKKLSLEFPGIGRTTSVL